MSNKSNPTSPLKTVRSNPSSLNETQLRKLVRQILLENQAYLDSLLDKIGTSGKNSLTPEELQYLHTHSETGEFPPIPNTPEPKQTKTVYEGMPIVSSGTIKMKFVFDSYMTDWVEHKVIYNGDFYFDNHKFTGAIYCNDSSGKEVFESANFKLTKASTSQNQIFDKFFEPGDDLYYVASGLEKTINKFIINEVLPKL